MSDINTALTVALLDGPPRCLSYAPSVGSALTAWPIGLRVQIPLGSRICVGVIVAHEPPPPGTRLKAVMTALDSIPLFDAEQLAQLIWLSRYYRATLGDILAAVLPPPLRTGSTLPVLATPQPPQPPQPQSEVISLHPEQASAVAVIAAGLDQFGGFLLEGVTGSGKTEVYWALAQRLLAQGRQVLVLVPEISLTPQLAARFQRRLGLPLLLLHSRLPAGERLRVWAQCQAGHPGVLLGTRLAVLTPLPNLGLVIVDEEHDAAYKQEESPRYHARDVAVLRAQWAKVPVVLGSATPSLESLANAAQGRYHHLHLRERAQAAAPPHWIIVDARRQPLRAGLTPALLAAIQTNLAAQMQTLLLLNQRGYAPVLLCHACGWQAQCHACDARLVLHQAIQRLRCHHCGAEQLLPSVCPACQSAELLPIGQGTQRLEQTLRQQFPQARLARLDRDSTQRKGQLEQTLTAMAAGEVDILLGTQMLAKGHDFPKVTLVGILDADTGLYSADLRASERLLQLLVQVAGRAGRGQWPGQVLLQTHQPSHPLLHRLFNQGYPAAAAQLLAERADAGWPPFSALALLRVEAATLDVAQTYATAVVQLATTTLPEDAHVLGPVPAPMARRQGRYRVQVLLQTSTRRSLQQWLDTWITSLPHLLGVSRVRWSLDIDPASLL